MKPSKPSLPTGSSKQSRGPAQKRQKGSSPPHPAGVQKITLDVSSLVAASKKQPAKAKPLNLETLLDGAKQKQNRSKTSSFQTKFPIKWRRTRRDLC